MQLHMTGRQCGGYVPGGYDFPDSGGGLSDEDVATAARVRGSVLLTGPLALALMAARRIHEESDRGAGPFTVVDCAGPPAAVTEQILLAFGPEAASRPGPEALGTVYMKDVGALPQATQQLVAGLLAHSGRGGLIASTREPLLDRVLENDFDDCLYYRLNVVHLMLGTT